MTDRIIRQMPVFRKTYKKLHGSQKSLVNDAIRTIASNPGAGEEKKADLAGVFVYKFKIHHQEMLLAYEWNPSELMLLALGVHENFYRDLKNRRQGSAKE